jgi:mitogen-activated protein kinase kinase
MLKSSRPLKTKRNFKALQLPELNVELGAAQQETEPVPSRPAPLPAAAADSRRRPPPLQAEAMSSPLTAGSPATGRTRSAIQASLTNTLARLDIMGGARLDLRNEDLTSLQELGHGNGGSVVKALHVPSGTIMAKKVSFVYVSLSAPGDTQLNRPRSSL